MLSFKFVKRANKKKKKQTNKQTKGESHEQKYKVFLRWNREEQILLIFKNPNKPCIFIICTCKTDQNPVAIPIQVLVLVFHGRGRWCCWCASLLLSMSLLWILSRSVRVIRALATSSSMLLTHFCALHRPLECAAATGAMLPQGQAEQHACHAHEFQFCCRRWWSSWRAGWVHRLWHGSCMDSAGGRRKFFASGLENHCLTTCLSLLTRRAMMERAMGNESWLAGRRALLARTPMTIPQACNNSHNSSSNTTSNCSRCRSTSNITSSSNRCSKWRVANQPTIRNRICPEWRMWDMPAHHRAQLPTRRTLK